MISHARHPCSEKPRPRERSVPTAPQAAVEGVYVNEAAQALGTYKAKASHILELLAAKGEARRRVVGKTKLYFPVDEKRRSPIRGALGASTGAPYAAGRKPAVMRRRRDARCAERAAGGCHPGPLRFALLGPRARFDGRFQPALRGGDAGNRRRRALTCSGECRGGEGAA